MKSRDELILAYWRYAEGYSKPDGDTTSELRCIREPLRPVRASPAPGPPFQGRR